MMSPMSYSRFSMSVFNGFGKSVQITMKVGHITDASFGEQTVALNLAEISRDGICRNFGHGHFDWLVTRRNGRSCRVRCSCRSPAIGKIDLEKLATGNHGRDCGAKAYPFAQSPRLVCRLAVVVAHRGANIEDFAHSQFTDCHFLLHEFFSEAKKNDALHSWFVASMCLILFHVGDVRSSHLQLRNLEALDSMEKAGCGLLRHSNNGSKDRSN